MEVEKLVNFTAKPVKCDANNMGKKWKCSEGCPSKENKGFWSQRQDVIKHIAVKHPDPQISYFECKLCYDLSQSNYKTKRYQHVSGYQVIEHLRVKHREHLSGASNVECQYENILALFNGELVRTRKESKEKWLVYVKPKLLFNASHQLIEPTSPNTGSYLPIQTEHHKKRWEGKKESQISEHKLQVNSVQDFKMKIITMKPTTT